MLIPRDLLPLVVSGFLFPVAGNERAEFFNKSSRHGIPCLRAAKTGILTVCAGIAHIWRESLAIKSFQGVFREGVRLFRKPDNQKAGSRLRTRPESVDDLHCSCCCRDSF